MDKKLKKDIIGDIASLNDILDSKTNTDKNENDISNVENLEIINSQAIEPFKKPKKRKSCKTSKKDKEKLVLEKMCIICGKVNTPGIVIMDKKICSCCEEKAVKADIKSEFYEDYKNKISKNVVGKLKNLG